MKATKGTVHSKSLSVYPVRRNILSPSNLPYLVYDRTCRRVSVAITCVIETIYEHRITQVGGLSIRRSILGCATRCTSRSLLRWTIECEVTLSFLCVFLLRVLASSHVNVSFMRWTPFIGFTTILAADCIVSVCLKTR